MNESLPASAILDSTVMIGAFSGRQDDESRFCAEFVTRMRGQRRRLWIAAPTLAEIRAGAAPIPLVEGITVVAFDRQASLVLADKMPHELVKQHRDEERRGPLAYYRFDSLIVACGLRWGADCLVTLDNKQRARSERVGLKAYHPRDLAERQQPIRVDGQPILAPVP